MTKALAALAANLVSILVWVLAAMFVWWIAGKIGAQDELSSLLGSAWLLVQDFASSVAASAREAAAK